MPHYTDKEVSEIFTDLGLKDQSLKEILKNTLDSAAQNYLYAKKSREEKLTDGEEKESLNRLASYLGKSAEAYQKIINSKGSIFRFYDGLSLSGEKYPKEHDLIIENSYDKYIMQPKFILGVLKMLQEASLEATKEPIFAFRKSTKTDIVVRWLGTIMPFWERYSIVHLSEGRHDEILKRYDSPAMRVLYKMANPLNIEGSMIAEAIKDYKAIGEMEEQSFFKKPKSLFQEK